MSKLLIRDSKICKIKPATALFPPVPRLACMANLFLNEISFLKPAETRKSVSRKVLTEIFAENVSFTDQRPLSIQKCIASNEDSKTGVCYCLRFCFASWTIRNTASTRNEHSWRFSQLLLVNIHKSLHQVETELQNAYTAFLATLSRFFIHEHQYGKVDMIAHEGCVHYNSIHPRFIAAINIYENMSDRSNSAVVPLYQSSVSECIAKWLHCSVEEINEKIPNTEGIKKEVMYEKIDLLLRKGVSRESILKYLQHIWNLDVRSMIDKLNELNLDVARLPLLLVVFDLDPSLMLTAEHIARKLNSTVDVIKSCVKENKFSLEVINNKLDLLLQNGIAGPDCIKLLPTIQHLELKTLEKVLNDIKSEEQSSFSTEKLMSVLYNVHDIVYNNNNPRIVPVDVHVNVELKTLPEAHIQDGFIHKLITKNLYHNQEGIKNQKNKEQYIVNGGCTGWDIAQTIKKETHVSLNSNISAHLSDSNDKFSHTDLSSSIEEYLYSKLGARLEDIPLSAYKKNKFLKINLSLLAVKIEHLLNEGLTFGDIVKLLPHIYERKLTWLNYVVEQTKKYNIDLMQHRWLLTLTQERLQNFLRNRDRSCSTDEFFYSSLSVRLKDIPLSMNDEKKIRKMKLANFEMKMEYFLSEGFSTEDIVKLLPFIYKRKLAWLKHVVEEAKKLNIDLREHGWLLGLSRKRLQSTIRNSNPRCLVDEFLSSSLSVRLKDIPLNRNDEKRIRMMKLAHFERKVEYFLSEGFRTEDIVKLLPFISKRKLACLKHVVEEAKKLNIELAEHGWLLISSGKKLQSFISKRDASCLVDEFLYSRLSVRLKDIPVNRNDEKRIRMKKLAHFGRKVECFLSEGFSTEDIVKLLPFIYKRKLAWLKHVVEEAKKLNIELAEHGWLLISSGKKLQSFKIKRDASCLVDEFLYSRLSVRLKDIPVDRNDEKRIRKMKLANLEMKVEYFLSEGFSTEDIVKLLPFIYKRKLAWLKHVVEEAKKLNIDLREHGWLLRTTEEHLQKFLSKSNR